jgi:hypothetical protein
MPSKCPPNTRIPKPASFGPKLAHHYLKFSLLNIIVLFFSQILVYKIQIPSTWEFDQMRDPDPTYTGSR